MSERSIDSGSSAGIFRWGAYLGCSWTWCIGMFLPALLLRDFGLAGYLVFAIPNVVGAALMGWVLRSRAQSESMLEKHATAIGWFSIITIAFHVYWIVWIFGFVQWMIPLPDEYLFGAGAIAVAWAIVSGRGIKLGRESQLAIVLWIMSLCVLIAILVFPDAIAPRTSDVISAISDQSPISTGAIWMIPVCLLGFGLCPYLDATFHHARQQLGSQAAGRAGFTLGFGVMFASMIVLTYQYAGLIITTLNGEASSIMIHPLMGAAILAHIMCQWIFTVRVHLARLPKLANGGPSMQSIYGVALLAGVAALLVPRISSHAGLTAGELVYRCFIGAYGLLFPAYVLFRVVRLRVSEQSTPMRWMWLVVGIATPMFWMGFMDGHPIWLAPGALIIASLALMPNQSAQPTD